MELELKGKLKQSVSVQMDDLLPGIKNAILEELGFDVDEHRLEYTSTTRFLTFDIINSKED